MSFQTNSYFDFDPDKIGEELKRLGKQWFRTSFESGPSDHDLEPHLSSWTAELQDILFSLEEGDDIGPLIEDLHILHGRMEDALGSIRHASRTTDSSRRDPRQR